MGDRRKKLPKGVGIVVGMALGLLMGVPLGAAMENLALGMAMGPALGLPIGFAIEHKGDAEKLTDTEKKARIAMAIDLGLIVVIAVALYFIMRSSVV